MGRPKKDKAPTQPKRTLEDLDDDDQFRLFKQNREKYEAVLKTKKAADAAIKNVCKVIKSDLGADGLRMIKTAIRIADGEADDIQREVDNTVKVARWLGAPIGTQFDMELDTSHFFDEGRRVGLAGEPCKPPPQLTPGSEHYTEWLAGHAAGQTALATKGFKAPANDEADLRPRFKQNDEGDAVDTLARPH